MTSQYLSNEFKPLSTFKYHLQIHEKSFWCHSNLRQMQVISTASQALMKKKEIPARKFWLILFYFQLFKDYVMAFE